MSKIITLTTDFGLADEYVGVMKGVILARAPEATIVDLSHSLARHNILQAALLIKAAYSFFPKKTIHVVVVDPGVGTKRRLLAVQADEHLFLAPDNGVLGLLMKPEFFEAAYEVKCKQFFLEPVSSIFHGRDILAPVAAQLAAGLEPVKLGPVVEPQSIKKLTLAEVRIDTGLGRVLGEVVAIDHFGNLQTNIPASSLKDFFDKENSTAHVTIKDKRIVGILETYANIAPGKVMALIGSRGFLEIAVNQGNAAAFLDAGIGAGVTVEMPKP